MENVFYQNFFEGMKLFLAACNPLFIVAFILVTWLFNSYADSEIKASWLSWLTRIPKVLRVLVLGIILAFIFAYFFRFNTREQISELFFSIIVGMVIWKLGLNKLFDYLSKKWLKT